MSHYKTGGSWNYARVCSRRCLPASAGWNGKPTGIGFLGTGAQFRDQHRTKELTTAATIRVVAAIAMAVGAGAYALSLSTTVLVFITLRILQPVSNRLSAPHPETPVAEDSADDEDGR